MEGLALLGVLVAATGLADRAGKRRTGGSSATFGSPSSERRALRQGPRLTPPDQMASKRLSPNLGGAPSQTAQSLLGWIGLGPRTTLGSRSLRTSRADAVAPARWAVKRDLSSLVVAGPVTGRVVIGHCGRKLIAAESGHSLLVVGPTQSGKTTGLAVPIIREWKGPVVAASVKGDLA